MKKTLLIIAPLLTMNTLAWMISPRSGQDGIWHMIWFFLSIGGFGLAITLLVAFWSRHSSLGQWLMLAVISLPIQFIFALIAIFPIYKRLNDECAARDPNALYLGPCVTLSDYLGRAVSQPSILMALSIMVVTTVIIFLTIGRARGARNIPLDPASRTS